MTLSEIQTLLEKCRDRFYCEYEDFNKCQHSYEDGFDDCLELMLPLIEALDKYTDQETYGTERVCGDFIPRGIAMSALQSLVEKLEAK